METKISSTQKFSNGIKFVHMSFESLFLVSLYLVVPFEGHVFSVISGVLSNKGNSKVAFFTLKHQTPFFVQLVFLLSY